MKRENFNDFCNFIHINMINGSLTKVKNGSLTKISLQIISSLQKKCVTKYFDLLLIV